MNNATRIMLYILVGAAVLFLLVVSIMSPIAWIGLVVFAGGAFISIKFRDKLAPFVMVAGFLFSVIFGLIHYEDDPDAETEIAASERAGETKVDVTTDEQSFYTDKTDIEIKNVNEQFDSVWTNRLTPVLSGLNEGTTSAQAAYQELTKAIDVYQKLITVVDLIPGDGLSAGGQDLLTSYKQAMTTAITQRQDAMQLLHEDLTDGSLQNDTVGGMEKMIEQADQATADAFFAHSELNEIYKK